MKKTQMASVIQQLAKMPYHLHYIFFFCIILNFSVSKSTLYDQEHEVLLNIKHYLSPFLSQWAPPDSSGGAHVVVGVGASAACPAHRPAHAREPGVAQR